MLNKSKSASFLIALSVSGLSFLFSPAKTYAHHYSYLNDAETEVSPGGPGPSIDDHEFPRLMILEIKTSQVPLLRYGKYHVIAAHGYAMSKVKNLQNTYPDVMFLRHISPRAYQGYNDSYCNIGAGMAFESTGPVTQGGPSSAGCSVYAGHWLYKAGTTLDQNINATTKTIKVKSAGKIAVGQYIVIYDAPAGSFNNAEHAKVTARNLSTNTLTLQSRGFKSTARSHSAGAIVAQHVIGQGSNPELWSYNLSTKSPKDGLNRTAGHALADWMAANLTKSGNGSDSGVDIAGVLFDADFYFELASKGSDVDNNMVKDDGMGPGGVNWWGQGLDDFYAKLRVRLPNLFIIGGTGNSRGFESLQGVQNERWPISSAPFQANPKYDSLDGKLDDYRFHMHYHEVGPSHVHNLSKSPAAVYPGSANPPPSDNSDFRFALGTTLLDDGYFGLTSEVDGDPWFDEYAVNVTPNSPNYGTAINKTDVDGVRQHRGWLGQPQGPYQRVYDHTTFDASRSLVSNGSFDTNLSGWSGINVNVSRDTANALEGAGALRASAHTSYRSGVSGASVKGPSVNTTKNVQYTFTFAAKAPVIRNIKATVGSSSETFLVGPNWRRYVMTFKAPAGGSQTIRFYVGRESTVVHLDSVYFFQGNANVFRRDFENGIVVVNATPSTRAVSLDGTFQRIDGTQDAINNGQSVSSVTLGGHDAILLVRQDGDQSGGGAGSGSASIGNFVWEDSNENGLQDGGEPGKSGVTVRLQDCSGSVLATTTTGAGGGYVFSSLDAGNYAVRFVEPSGYSFSPPNQGVEGQDSDADPATGLTTCMSIAANQTRVNVDAGLIADGGGGGGGGSGNASIGDFVWEDLNENGVQDGGEPGKSGVTVHLQNCTGGVLATTTTGASGSYVFDSLDAGNYVVKFVAPSGYSFSPPNQGSGGKDSNPNPATGSTTCMSMSANQARVGIDAGLMADGTGGGGGGGPISACWPPTYDPQVDKGYFIWKNCNTNMWHARVTAGGSANAVQHTGTVTSDKSMSNIAGFSLEETDSVTPLNVRKRINFDLYVIGVGEDGMQFKPAATATQACLTLSSGGPIFVGSKATQVNGSLNLLNPGAACP